jgi:hypothetical protein
MNISVEEICAAYKQRSELAGPMLAQMREVREVYNGDLAIPLPEMDRNEKAAIPNLLQQGIDQTGMRIASTMPMVWYPPVTPGDRASEKRASTRRKATLGWWQENRLPLKMRRRARYLIGYASSPVILRPNKKTGIARWELRDPLSCFPAPCDDPDEITPADTIFGYTRSLHWLRERYPEQMRLLYQGDDPKPNDAFDVVEYMDADETVLVVAGKHKPYTWHRDEPLPGAGAIELLRIKNRIGLNPAVVPGRITLDRPLGQFSGMVGMYQASAKLMALDLIAVEKGVFPDIYLESRANETADFIAGPYDGRSGLVNIVKGGVLRETSAQAGLQTAPTMDRLERAQRLSGGVPAEFGGESPGNVRTGKRGDAVLSAVIDFPIQEAQEILAWSLAEENKRAVAIVKEYFPTRKSFYVSMKGGTGRVDYTPGKDFETDDNVVTYSQAGADVNSLVIGAGQRVGMGTMSKRTFQEIDPLVADPELEHDRVISESLEQALLESVQQQASSGSIPPADIARIAELVLTDKVELAEAIQQVQKEAQERQSTTADPVAAGDPAAQPGLAAPGMGAEAGVETIEPPGASASNLAAIFQTLRSPQRQLPAERGAA